MQKVKLTVEKQIEHMLSKGISFNIFDKDYATDFLINNTYYFKIKAYAKNFEKYNNGPNIGKYVNLDFAYLVDLSQIDMAFSRFVLKLVLDIEHCLRVRLISSITQDPDEDGYTVVDAFLENRTRIKNQLEIKSINSTCSDLFNKYHDALPIWVLIELLSFGDLVNFYKFYYKDYKYPASKEHTKIITLLNSAKYLRNASAHCNCFLNSVKTPYVFDKSKFNATKTTLSYLSQGDLFTSEARKKKMKNPVINDFLSTLYLYSLVVKSKGMYRHRIEELNDLFDHRMLRNKDYYKSNNFLTSSYKFVRASANFILCP